MTGQPGRHPPSLDPDLLLRAYAAGVFPMADSRSARSVYWVEPKTRAVLPLDGFRLSRSLRKSLGRFTTTADTAFGDIVRLCAQSSPDRPDTWINAQIEDAVAVLHRRGFAHSIETWDGGTLVGGLYGLAIGRAFFGESMVSRATDASKVALAHLVARLRAGGYTLLDCQFQTPHLASLGAVEIDRSAYMALLASAVSPTPGSPTSASSADFFAIDRLPTEPGAAPSSITTVSGPTSAWRIVQSLAQTS